MNMHAYPEYFAHRHPHDALDCAPLIVAGLRQTEQAPALHCEERAIPRGESAQRVAQLQRWFAQQGLEPGDRVAVMHEGHITGILERPDCNEQNVMQLAIGKAIPAAKPAFE